MNEILFFIFDTMTDYEITFAMHMLNTNGNKNVVTIAYEDQLITSRSGAVYKPHRLVRDSKNFEAEGLVICGGWYGVLREDLESIIKKFEADGRLLAGICGAGTFLLAEAGVLDNKRFTTPITEWGEKQKEIFGLKDPFNRKNYMGKNVVVDKNIITSLGHSFIEFTVELLEWFQFFSNEKEKDDFHNFMKGN